MTTFAGVLDAADDLSLEEQETLVEILRRRIARHNRDVLVREVAEARAEFHSGGSHTVSVNEIMDEVRGESWESARRDPRDILKTGRAYKCLPESSGEA